MLILNQLLIRAELVHKELKNAESLNGEKDYFI